MTDSESTRATLPWLSVLLVLLVAGMALRIIFAAGFIPVDDAEYARIAARLLDGTFSWEEHFGPPVNPGRLGVVLPLLAAFKAFGPNEISMAAYPLALSLLTMLLLYAFTARIFGRVAGLIALAIWIFIPLDLEFSAKVNPDTAVTAYAMLGLFAIYCARRHEDNGASKLFLHGALAGLAFGAAWLSKASTVYFVPFCLIVLTYDLIKDWKPGAHLWGGVAAGSIAVFGSEMVFYAATTGDPFYRFYIIELNYQLYPEFFFNEGAKWGYEVGVPYWKAIVKRLLLEGPATFFLSPDYMYLPTLALVAAAYGLYKADERFYFMSVLLATLLAMFNFFSASLENYQPLPLFTRYSHSLCFVGAVLSAGLLSRLLEPSVSRAAFRARSDGLFWGSMLAVCITIAAGWSTFRTVRDTTTTWAAAERALADTIRPEDRVYTDPLSRAGLEFFWGYPQKMNIVNIAEMTADDTVACDSFVLLNNNYTNWLVNNFGMWYTMRPYTLPDIMRAPPPEWQRTWTNGNAQLYEVRCAAG